MRPKDVREAVEIVAADPTLAPRYGATLADLASTWLRLLGSEAFRAIVLDSSLEACNVEMVGLGVSAFVTDDFLREVKTPPFFWVGPEITKRVMCGISPLLSNKQVRQANSGCGLNLIVWEGVVRAGYRSEPEIHNAMLGAFMETHRGFLLKELLGHGTNVEGLQATFRMGNLFLNSRNGEYVDHMDKTPEELLSVPHRIGISRELALSRPGTWIGSLFIYHAPVLGLRPSEQHLLLTALRGRTDEELADELGLSLSAVKKAWLSIYDRTSVHLPGLVPSRFPTQQEGERGKEKKQRLLAYVREHPEELRPASP
jgi:DNA-binding CsgD family transcriptional regulator